jgi:hypothetical protein
MRKWWIPWTLGIALTGLMGIPQGTADPTITGPFSVQKSVRITEITTRTPTSVQSTRTNTTTITITKPDGKPTTTTSHLGSHTFTLPRN